MTSLTLEGVDVAYGDSEVLFGVDLEVAAGEMVALLGSNGAGKSTTLRAISGLAPVKRGRILLDGKDITNIPSHRIAASGLAHCPESRRLFPRMTVRENLELAVPRGQHRAATREAFDEVVDLFPILGVRSTQMAGLMSGGEQQMCAIGRALMAKPKILLLDEPSLGLAPHIITEVFQTIRRINDRGMTVLLVEQNSRQALRLASRAYILERGRVTMDGPSDQLRNDPDLQKAYLGI